ncbi:MAG: minichromosome maintenance protein MCM [Thermoplasmata archaeon]|nr:minichromosome maintenance protein MCM [Thermoplasmata archaeon]
MALVTHALPAHAQLVERWTQILEEGDLRARILDVAARFPEERSIVVPFATVDSVDAAFADLLLERPEEMLAAGREAIRAMLPVSTGESEHLRLRVDGLPPTVRRAIRGIRETDLGQFVAVEGIVRKSTEVRPLVKDAVFQCLSCKNEVHETQEESSPVFREPIECTACGKPMGRTRFRFVPERSTFIDAQRIEIQENPESLKGGAHPQGLPVLLTEDLAGRLIPGNRVILNGVLKGLQRAAGGGRGGLVRSTSFELLLLDNSVEHKHLEYDEIPISEEEERLFRTFENDPQILDKIVLSLAPTIKGMEEEKEAIALQLFGGVEKKHADGIRVRGDIHILIIGDPGTAKSQLLRYIADVAPRGIYTSGKGATAAGLTAAAVKDDFAGGRWVLEAGMLVLADGGMAIVDELDKMTPEDRSAMHEALEQQTVSIAKAGITATLNARCPVLAAANPKWGRFTSDRTISEQIDLPPTLLSRFDVIYSIQDRPNQVRDRLLANRILQSHQEVAGVSGATTPSDRNAPFSADLLRKYIAYARRTVRPQLSDAALAVIEEFYVEIRKSGEEPNAPVPITARQLEALVRLSEASARARLSVTVSEEDARRATRIVEGFLKRVSTTEGRLDIDILTTGFSHSQRERLEILQGLMRALQQKAGSFSLEELKAEASTKEIPPARVDALFTSLRSQGELVEIRPDRWQMVRFG